MGIMSPDESNFVSLTCHGGQQVMSNPILQVKLDMVASSRTVNNGGGARHTSVNVRLRLHEYAVLVKVKFFSSVTVDVTG